MKTLQKIVNPSLGDSLGFPARTFFICTGLPASGKSTWANSLEETNVVNRDSIRKFLGIRRSNWSGGKEKKVTELRDRDLKMSMENPAWKYVVSDDTNLSPKVFRHLQRMGESLGWNVVHVEFTTDIDTCIKRDSKRDDGFVGADVIRGMYYRYMVPKMTEFPTPIEGADNAVLCDLDGTAALLNGRSPYDASTCDMDIVNPSVKFILEQMETVEFHEKHTMGAKTKLFFFSGREDKYREQTLKFLRKLRLPEFELHMRKSGDTRKDKIIKRELYENHIAGKYNVSLVLDDRPQVVRLWQELGLPVLNAGRGLEF